MPTIGMDNTCEVVFEKVGVAEGDIIGNVGEGREILEATSPRATIAKCAEMLGGCGKCIKLTADYAKKRIQYGKPIGWFQVIQHYMADMLLPMIPPKTICIRQHGWLIKGWTVLLKRLF